MKKWYVSAGLGLFFVALVTSVFAASPDPGQAGPANPARFQGAKPYHHGFGSFLNLSDEQKAKMKELRDRSYADTRDLRYGIIQKRVEMRKLFTDPKTDDATLAAKQKELNTLRQKLMEMKSQAKLEWRKLLTAEQIQKLDRLPMGRGMGRGHRADMM
jgi:Spy/CpxP family protein refolding chaperone